MRYAFGAIHVRNDYVYRLSLQIDCFAAAAVSQLLMLPMASRQRSCLFRKKKQNEKKWRKNERRIVCLNWNLAKSKNEESEQALASIGHGMTCVRTVNGRTLKSAQYINIFQFIRNDNEGEKKKTAAGRHVGINPILWTLLFILLLLFCIHPNCGGVIASWQCVCANVRCMFRKNLIHILFA